MEDHTTKLSSRPCNSFGVISEAGSPAAERRR